MNKKAKYWIYHVPGIKIGVSNNPEHRVIKQQGYKEYEILEEHTNIKEVSKREIELQKQYGYPVDKIEYWKFVKNQKKSYTPEARKKAAAKTDYTIVSAKRSANTDWKARTAKRDYKAAAAKVDWKTTRAKGVANTDWVKAGEIKKIPVNQYDLEGNLIKRWDSAKDAAIKLFNNKKRQSGISQCCKGQFKTAFKFIWKYEHQ